MFQTLEDALSWINVQRKFKKTESLDTMKEALRLLGNPEESFKSVHIGGTNGKGSVSLSLSLILKEAGQKVGLYVSPFVVKPNERIQINNEYISDDDFLRLVNFVYEFNESFKIRNESLTFFEFLTIIAFLYFKEQKIDIAIIEVGLGGRLDCTNVIHPLVSAVTNIQKDHMNELGNTYKKILREKLGIMKPKIPFVTTIEKEELIPIIKEQAYLKESPLYFVRNVRNPKLHKDGTSFSFKGYNRYKTGLIGLHQAKNAALAIEICDLLNERYDYKITKDMIDKALLHASWPCRFEVFDDVIIDGGHNPEGLEALKKTIIRYTPKNIITIFTCMKDKEYEKMIPIIESFSNSIIYTEIDYGRCIDPKILYDFSIIENKKMIRDYKESLEFALKNKKEDEIILISGSLYFTSRMRELVIKGTK